jgi:S1-C subfamily serine protease
MKKILVLIILTLSLYELSFSQTSKSRDEWKQYFQENLSSLDPIEGLWNVTVTPTITRISDGRQLGGDQTATNLFAVIKGVNGFDAICVNNDFPWVTTFEKSANPKIYFYKETIKGTKSGVNANVKLSDDGIIEFSFYYTDDFKQKLFPDSPSSFNRDVKMHVQYQWIKAFPMQADIDKSMPSSGTGFAITKDGIIATNFHVIENGKTIIVKGINGDFNRSFKAVILVSDQKNDVALLKIDDPNFIGFSNIPFTIKRELSSVGEDVFVLGYPLRATMGDEIKLTNGIISSKTGFQGDITSYQISAPVQPGNSGGPLFDKSGNLIAIVNAKYAGAENVTYAIKSSYLYNLIELLDVPPQLPSVNILTNLSLADQVKVIKEFIFIIEVN